MNLEAIKTYAILHKVPIMSDDTLAFISSIIKETNSRSILEIGTAIAFSASTLVYNNEDINIRTIEKDEARYAVAVSNVEALNYVDKIECLNDDGLLYKNRDVYDMAIIDAAKAQNLSFFKLYFPFTEKVMVIDNINFHGNTGNSETIKHRRTRQMVIRIENFINYVESRSDLLVSRHDVGDGIMVIKRKV